MDNNTQSKSNLKTISAVDNHVDQSPSAAAFAHLMKINHVMNPIFLQVIVEELRELGRMALPLTAMNCVVYVRAMVSVLCLGRLGSLELAGGALSVGFTNITGYSVLFGLASGMDPVCSQAYGSKNWTLISLSLQRTILMLLSTCIPISIMWLNLHRILLALGQNPNITRVASIYCVYSLPDLVANSLLQPLRVFLRSQGNTAPMMWCSILAVTIHVPLTILLVFVFELGVPGVAIAAAWTNFHMVIFLVLYMWLSGSCRQTWGGWSIACFHGWWPLLSLALPSCFAICLEWWWYEVLTILAGYLPNPQDSIASTSILIQTTSFMYTFPLALSSSVSVRVGNELGAGRPARARVAAWVALACAAGIGFTNLAWTTLFRHAWGRVFTRDGRVLMLTASVMPIVGLCELGNCPQTTGCGVLRGSARPAIGARINLGSFYFVGTPVAVGLAFWYKAGFVGLWFGLLAAQAACAFSILLVVSRTDWAHEAAKAKRLACGIDGGGDGDGDRDSQGEVELIIASSTVQEAPPKGDGNTANNSGTTAGTGAPNTPTTANSSSSGRGNKVRGTYSISSSNSSSSSSEGGDEEEYLPFLHHHHHHHDEHE